MKFSVINCVVGTNTTLYSCVLIFNFFIHYPCMVTLLLIKDILWKIIILYLVITKQMPHSLRVHGTSSPFPFCMVYYRYLGGMITIAN